jgi:hypothetical protein
MDYESKHVQSQKLVLILAPLQNNWIIILYILDKKHAHHMDS